MPELPKYVFLRGNRLWMKLAVSRKRGGWKNLKTPYTIAQDPAGQLAARFRRLAQERLDAGLDLGITPGRACTVFDYGSRWVPRREKDGVASWDDDESRLKTHVYPAIGKMALEDVRARHIAEMIRGIRAKAPTPAPRTVRNIYSVTKSLFRDAQIDGLIDANPCILTKRQLGKIRDGKTGWRAQAIFVLDETEQLVSDVRIPWDRRIVHGLLFLGMLRQGEMAGLRWKHLVTGLAPLGRIVVSTSYDDGTTKTEVERWMPVHPVLAGMLAEWKMTGWKETFGRAPEPEDLVVPHPRPTNRGRRVEFGGMRSDHDTYKRLRKDCDVLGFPHRRTHDARRTGITLAREGGADKDILRLCTHGTDNPQDVMEAYTSFGWARLCAQVQCLKIQRRVAAAVRKG